MCFYNVVDDTFKAQRPAPYRKPRADCCLWPAVGSWWPPGDLKPSGCGQLSFSFREERSQTKLSSVQLQLRPHMVSLGCWAVCVLGLNPTTCCCFVDEQSGSSCVFTLSTSGLSHRVAGTRGPGTVKGLPKELAGQRPVSRAGLCSSVCVNCLKECGNV